MTIRLVDPPIDHTGKLLVEILRVTLKGERVLFVCPAGESKALISRVRMKLSRERDKARDKGRRIQEFQLHATVHPETHDGIRYDAVVMWQVQSRYQKALLEVENMLALDELTQDGDCK